MKKLLGISLALVMLLGSIPLGFSESLRVQLEQGIETDQLQCNNPDHVLVLCTNGNVACVTERTALKTGWEILREQEIIAVSLEQEDWTLPYRELTTFDYEFPLHAKNNKVDRESGDLFRTHVDLQIDRLSPIGETANITLEITYESDVVLKNALSEDKYNKRSTKVLVISDNFEFVSVSEGVIQELETGSIVRVPVDYVTGETHTMNATIKTVKEGLGTISAAGVTSGVVMHVGVAPTETLLREDYLAKYPPQIAAADRSTQDYQRLSDMKEFYPENYPTDEIRIVDSHITKLTEKNLRDLLTDLKWSKEDIAERIKETFPEG